MFMTTFATSWPLWSSSQGLGMEPWRSWGFNSFQSHFILPLLHRWIDTWVIHDYNQIHDYVHMFDNVTRQTTLPPPSEKNIFGRINIVIYVKVKAMGLIWLHSHAIMNVTYDYKCNHIFYYTCIERTLNLMTKLLISWMPMKQ